MTSPEPGTSTSGASAEGANPYAPPSAETKVPAAGAYQLVRLGLAEFAVVELLSIPFVWRAREALERKVERDMIGVGADQEGLKAAAGAFDGAAGVFYLVRAVAEVGLVLAIFAGLVWLYQSWAALPKAKKQQRSLSARAVVLWMLVPVYGYWRLFGFLTELARRNRVEPRAVQVGRWSSVTAAYLAVHFLAVESPGLGLPETADSLLSAVSALLGIKMLGVLQRAQAARAR